jgi:hypothetical protein
MHHVALDQIPLATLESLVNTTFTLRLDDRSVELQLSQVTRPRSAQPKFETFSLIFSGSCEPALPQQIFRLQHERLGAFDLFLVPIAREPDGMKYEAVFNRNTAT